MEPVEDTDGIDVVVVNIFSSVRNKLIHNETRKIKEEILKNILYMFFYNFNTFQI